VEQMAPSCDTNNGNFLLQLATNSQPITISGLPNPPELDSFSILTHGSQWQGVNYKLCASDALSEPMPGTNFSTGTIYRSVSDPTNQIRGNWLMRSFTTNTWSDYHRVIDGVVRLKLRVLDTNGFQILNTTSNADITVSVNQGNPESYQFLNDQVPGFVEVELAILEPTAVELLRAAQSGPARTNILAQNMSKIHVFRQQIPIRSATR